MCRPSATIFSRSFIFFSTPGDGLKKDFVNDITVRWVISSLVSVGIKCICWSLACEICKRTQRDLEQFWNQCFWFDFDLDLSYIYIPCTWPKFWGLKVLRLSLSLSRGWIYRVTFVDLFELFVSLTDPFLSFFSTFSLHFPHFILVLRYLGAKQNQTHFDWYAITVYKIICHR